jgi:hypothetical protein
MKAICPKNLENLCVQLRLIRRPGMEVGKKCGHPSLRDHETRKPLDDLCAQIQLINIEKTPLDFGNLNLEIPSPHPPLQSTLKRIEITTHHVTKLPPF